MRRDAQLIAALTLLGALRLTAGAVLPLSADEAYYWLWSRHLALGYLDHPPAIAYAIRAGTVLFGDTAFGVRVVGIVLSFAASWFVWRAGATLLEDEKAGALACLLFNLTLMVAVETMAATPDAPSIAASAAFLWTLAKLAETGRGRWWLMAGLAAGLGLLSKYTAFFLGLGALAWMVLSPPMRRWLLSPWPYLGGLVALAVFAPNFLWNARHGWATFAFQFGRIDGGHFTLRYLVEFLGAQAALATPFILVLGVLGLVAVSRGDKRRALLAALLWPSIAYFVLHALHDRVQGNWPCFLYPALAVAAADAARQTEWKRWRAPLARWSEKLAIPVAAALLLAAYAQAFVGVVPMGRRDPMARLLAVGFPQVAKQVEQLRVAAGARTILTTDYETAAWFSFYAPAHPAVVDLGEDRRWPDAPEATAAMFEMPALYVTEQRRDRHDLVAARFAEVTEIAHFDRLRQGVPIAHYVVYRASGPTAAGFGRIP